MTENERRYSECPKCGARGGCEKHGLSASGIDLRQRAMDLAAERNGYPTQPPLTAP